MAALLHADVDVVLQRGTGIAAPSLVLHVLAQPIEVHPVIVASLER